jgi:beta-galactosidase GanA
MSWAAASCPSSSTWSPSTRQKERRDVEHVAVDGQDSLHWGYRPDDPQLAGRILVIESGKGTFLFVHNLKSVAQSIEVKERLEDVINGGTVRGRLALKPYQSLVLRRT